MRWTVLGAVAAGCVVGGAELVYEFPDATSLGLELANGSVVVDDTFDGPTTVEWDGGGIGDAATPEVREARDGAVTVDARGQLGGGDLAAHVVPGLPVRVLLDRGDVTVDLEAPSDLDLCVGAGSVDVTLPPGEYDLDVDLGAGSVDLEVPDTDGAAFSVRVCQGAGDVRIRIPSPLSVD